MTDQAPAKGLTMFVGAGLSFGSGPPLFDQLRAIVLGKLDLDSCVRHEEIDADKRRRRIVRMTNDLSRLAPEVFMGCLGGSVAARGRWLTEVLDYGIPNPSHRLVAQALGAGATVWTPNADQLIEVAYRTMADTEPDTSVWPDDPHPSSRLLKPHGSVTTSRFLFTSEEVVQPLRAAWARRLTADIEGRDVIFFGYRGVDFDLQPVLARAMKRANSIIWICPENEREDKIRLYPSLAGTSSEVRTASHTPQLPGIFSSLMRSWGFEDNPQFEPPPDRGDDDFPALPSLRYSQAQALLKAGEHELAWPVLKQAYGTASWRDRIRLSRALSVEGIYGRHLPRTARNLDRLVHVRRLLPPPLRDKLMRGLTTLHGFHDYDYEWVAQYLGGDLEEPGALNARALAHRYLGNADAGLADSARAYDLALAFGQPAAAANAAFQACYLATWAGQEDAFRYWKERAYDRIDKLSSYHWIAWSDFQLSRGLAYTDADAARAAVGRALMAFEAEGDRGGQVSCRILELTVLRAQGLHPEHDRKSSALLAEPLSLTQRLSVQLEQGERAYDVDARSERSRVLFADVARDGVTRPFFLGWALAGLARTAANEAERTKAHVRLRRLTFQTGFAGLTSEFDRVTERGGPWLLTP